MTSPPGRTRWTAKKLARALAKERAAELENELEQDEQPIDYTAELEDAEEEAAPSSEKRLKRELRAEALRRLEDEGAVASRWCEDASGPRRREYELTEQGLELAEQWLDALRARQRLDELLVGLLEGGLNAAGRSREGAQAPSDG